MFDKFIIRVVGDIRSMKESVRKESVIVQPLLLEMIEFSFPGLLLRQQVVHLQYRYVERSRIIHIGGAESLGGIVSSMQAVDVEHV